MILKETINDTLGAIYILRVPGGKYHIYTLNEMKTFDTSECVNDCSRALAACLRLKLFYSFQQTEGEKKHCLIKDRQILKVFNDILKQNSAQ